VGRWLPSLAMQCSRNTGVLPDAVQQHDVSQSKDIDGTHEKSVAGNTDIAVFVNRSMA